MASETTQKNRGWTVTLAGLGINLALGVLYTWSLFKAAIEKDFGWKGAQLNDPYALCCLVFAFTMILAGCSWDSESDLRTPRPRRPRSNGFPR